MIWFTADLHFFHSKIIKHSKRPFKTAAEMNEVIINNWNKVVKKDDLVIVLGDVSWAGSKKTKECIDRLNGDKTLIKGNHDKGTKKWFNIGFNLVIEKGKILIGQHQVNLSHYPYYPSLLTRIYVWTKEIIKQLCGIRVSHAMKKTLDKRLKDDGRWLLHGHIHNRYKIKEKMINVGVDVWDYTPVSINQIEEIINGN